MKKVILVIAILSFSSNAYAQTKWGWIKIFGGSAALVGGIYLIQDSKGSEHVSYTNLGVRTSPKNGDFVEVHNSLDGDFTQVLYYGSHEHTYTSFRGEDRVKWDLGKLSLGTQLTAAGTFLVWNGAKSKSKKQASNNLAIGPTGFNFSRSW